MDGSPAQSSPGTTDAAGLRFADLRLGVGDRLQLQMPKQAAGDRSIVRLIGYANGVSVLVTAPYQNGARIELVEGEEVVVRAFTRRSAFGFPAIVQRAVRHPLAYLHLSFPQVVQAVQVRKAIRVRTAIIAAVSLAGRGAEPVSAMVADVSSSGALLDAAGAIGEPGALLRVALRVRLHHVDSDLTVQAVIRNRCAEYADASGGIEVVHHGIEFTGLGPTERMVLESLIYQQLAEDPGGLA